MLRNETDKKKIQSHKKDPFKKNNNKKNEDKNKNKKIN